MPTVLTVFTFFPDGGAPERAEIAEAQVSDRWLSVCGDILDNYGPVFRLNMGSTLAHFDIHLAGPIGRLLVHGIACYEVAISRGTNSEQDKSAVNWFRDFFCKACEVQKSEPSEEALSVFTVVSEVPSVMLFDYCNPQISDDQKVAIVQLETSGVRLAKLQS